MALWGKWQKRVDKSCVDVRFEGIAWFLGFDDEGEYLKSKNLGHTHVFLVEKFDNKEEKDIMLEVGDKVVVTKVVENILEGIEVGKVGEIVDVDYSDYVEPYLINFGDRSWWAGRDFLVEKVEDGETGDTPEEEGIEGAEIRHSVNVVEDNVGEALTVEEVIKSVIEENQGTKESENTPAEGAYNTVIEKDGLIIYTNYSVEVVGEVMRVGGVDDLVVDFVESEDGGGELGE